MCVAEILWIRSADSVAVQPWQAALGLLPWTLFFAAFFPITYLQWFGSARSGLAIIVLKTFFWIWAVMCVFILVGMYDLILP
jgi:uncharacterized phage infection (PIP) family protein YhgE